MGILLPLLNKEEQLVKALKKSDARAQRLLYEKYSGRMMAVCFRYVNDRTIAEDVLIEGFMKVFDKIGQYKSEGSLEGWIRRIMVNESLGYLRKHKHQVFQENIEDAHDVHDYQVTDSFFAQEDLMAMIGKLSTGYQTVFNLYAIEGYSHAEIAMMLGITESTSKSQLHRARAILQQMVLDWENEHKKKVNYEKASG